MTQAALAITTSYLLKQPGTGAVLELWDADVKAEGLAAEHSIIPDNSSVRDVWNLVADYSPSYLQLFGRVPAPVIRSGVDGHGTRPSPAGDCVYATADLKAWQPQSDGSFGSLVWPADAVRSVSRIDTSGLQTLGQEAELFQRVMARNHAYRTGAFSYDGLAALVDRLDYMNPALTDRLRRQQEATVGVGNVLDLTRAFPDNTFFETFAGRSFLLGDFFSGGLEFSVGEYYVGTLEEFGSGSVPCGLVRIFCSNGWRFEDWPLVRAALVGGAVAVLYDPWGYADLTGWTESRTIGETVRGDLHRAGLDTLWTLQGDATLLRRTQEMGVSQATFDAYTTKTDARLDKIEKGGGGGVTTTDARLLLPSGIELLSAVYASLTDRSKSADVTDELYLLLKVGPAWVYDENRPHIQTDPAFGSVKDLTVTYRTAAGVETVKVVPQRGQVVLK